MTSEQKLKARALALGVLRLAVVLAVIASIFVVMTRLVPGYADLHLGHGECEHGEKP